MKKHYDSKANAAIAAQGLGFLLSPEATTFPK